MMPAITDVYSNFAISCFKHRMPSVTFHIVCALIEVANSWDVILE
jgi:hypothetical protein